MTRFDDAAARRYARIEIVRTEPEVVEVDEQGREWVGVPTYHLRLRAGNGRILAHSETYANKANAKRAVQSWADAFADINGGSRRPWPAVEVDR